MRHRLPPELVELVSRKFKGCGGNAHPCDLIALAFVASRQARRRYRHAERPQDRVLRPTRIPNLCRLSGQVPSCAFSFGANHPDVFSQVQTMLQKNGRSGGLAVGNKHDALLRGLLRCNACDCGMSHTYSAKGSRQYRYYVCHRAQKRG